MRTSTSSPAAAVPEKLTVVLRRVGRVEEVLVEGPSRTDAALLRGRTRRNTTVNFAGTATAGDLVDVRIKGSSSTTLRGAQAVSVAA